MCIYLLSMSVCLYPSLFITLSLSILRAMERKSVVVEVLKVVCVFDEKEKGVIRWVGGWNGVQQKTTVGEVAKDSRG